MHDSLNNSKFYKEGNEYNPLYIKDEHNSHFIFVNEHITLYNLMFYGRNHLFI